MAHPVGFSGPIHYRFSPAFALRWLASAAVHRRRDLIADGREQLARQGAERVLLGAEHLPLGSPFILIVNHYERQGIRMWWTAWYATVLVADAGGGAIRWFATNRFRGWRPYGVPLVPGIAVRWFLRLVGHAYELLLVDPTDAAARGQTIREAYRTLHHDRRPVGLAPEAGNAPGLSRQLTVAVPESGAAIAWLSRGLVPVVPMAIWEEDGRRIMGSVGPPYLLERPAAKLTALEQEALTERVMRSVAVLLPSGLRGVYAEAGGPG